MGGRGYGGVGRGRVYAYRYTVTTRMTSALRWAAMRAILMFHNCEGQSHKTASTDHNFWSQRRAETDSNRGPSAYQPTALPLGQTGSLQNPGTNGAFMLQIRVSYQHWCRYLLGRFCSESANRCSVWPSERTGRPASRAGYCMRRSDWLELVAWLATRNCL